LEKSPCIPVFLFVFQVVVVYGWELASSKSENRITDLINWDILPPWFANIPQRLQYLSNTDRHTAPDTIKTHTKVAGGTDLWVQQAPQLAHQPLVFLDAEENIELSQQRCTISATTRIETLRLSPFNSTTISSN